MIRTALSLLVALFSLVAIGLAIPIQSFVDEYSPDLITVVNQFSSGGEYYLKSSTGKGLEGDLSVQITKSAAAYSDHREFAPDFFIRGGDLYSMTNSTHIMSVVALNVTYHTNNLGYTGPKHRYKLQLVEPSKAESNTGVGVGKYAPGKWSWYGPTLLYAFGPEHKDHKGTLVYSCMDGVYLDIHSGAPPPGCTPTTLHARNVLRLH